RINAADGQGATFEKATTISVTGVNDAPTALGLSPAAVAENSPLGTTVGNLSSTDPESGDTHTYSLVSGTGSTDNGSFTINGTAVQTNTLLDYETKNSYSIRVQTDDGHGHTFQKALTISVTDVNDAPSDIGLSNSTIVSDKPSGTTVGTLSSTDQDVPANSFTYSLVSGTGSTDNASFQISGSTLQTAAPLDFEAGGTRSVRIRTDDGHGGTFDKVFTITVNDKNDAPTDIALSNSSVAENQASGTTVGTFSSTDQDSGDTHTYTLVSGTGSTDNGQFTIDGSGNLKTAASIDFETKSSYSIRVKTDDGNGGTFEKVVTISVTDVNETPNDLGPSPASVAENTPLGTTVGNLSSTDPESGDT